MSWTPEELKKIRAAYLGAHKKLREMGVAKPERNRIAKEEVRAVKANLLRERAEKQHRFNEAEGDHDMGFM